MAVGGFLFAQKRYTYSIIINSYPMTKGNKIFWVVIAIVIVRGIVFLNSRQTTVAPTTNTNTNTAPTEITNKPETKPTTPTKVPAGSYQEMVKKYEGRRIQINDACQATPSSQTFKNGTQVMFDNRGSKAIKLTVDGVSYPTSAYTYRLIPLTSKTLPHSVIINCNGQNNIAQFNLQQ